jgi:two-component system, OmpR family, sensor kinase
MKNRLNGVFSRPPLRVRITAAASASIAVILVTLSLLVYIRLHAELLRAIDSGLQARASAIAGSVGQLRQARHAISDGPDVSYTAPVQILTPGGHVVAQSGTELPPLPARYLRHLSQPTYMDVSRPRLPAPMRLYLLPVDEGRPLVIVAGTTLAGLAQTMKGLGLLLLVGDPAAVALASAVAWVMTGAALRPVERMRREAAAYSVSEPMLRLPLPESNDEIARLGETLNSLLDRLQATLDRERRLLDDASHELRTPLSTLKAEIDLALSRSRSPGELKAALRSASEETNRLSRLAQDLLVLSRTRDGSLPIHRVSTDLSDMLDRACARHRPQADKAGCQIECDAQPVTIAADPMRLTQALDNLLDNAVRYSESAGRIVVTADVRDDAVTITIENPGPGFPGSILETAFEPFVSGSQYRAIPSSNDGILAGQPGAGLGLAIVRAVALAHDGSVTAANVPGGARVTMTLLPSPRGAASRAAAR